MNNVILWLTLICGLLAFPACTTTPPPVTEPTDHPVTICTPLVFADFTVAGKVTQAGASRLMKEKIGGNPGEPDDYEFLTTGPNGTNRIRVETGEQYLAARKQGASGYSIVDMAMEACFRARVGPLLFLTQAQPAKHSFLSSTLLPDLSVGFLGWNDSDQEAALNRDVALGKTIRDYARSGRVKRMEAKPHRMTFDFDGRYYVVEEMARGDHDGDGVEDALIAVYWHYREGSGFGYSFYVVSKPAAGSVCAVSGFGF